MTLLVKKKTFLLQKKGTLVSKLTINQNNSLYYEYEESKFNTYINSSKKINEFTIFPCASINWPETT